MSTSTAPRQHHLTEREPRASTEADQRHLLASFETASTIDGDRTPRAVSPAPSAATTLVPTQQPYRGFPSKEAYLEALNSWAESKRYVEPENALYGFYGHTTMQTLAEKPRVELGISKKIKQIRKFSLRKAA